MTLKPASDSDGLILDKLHVTKGNSTLLESLSLTIEPGQCLAVQCNHITGSLIIDVLMDKSKLSAGRATWGGHPLSAASSTSRIGWIRQSDAIHERLNAREALTFYMKLYGSFNKARVDRLLQLVGLHERQYIPLGKCSVSEQRRFHLARGAVHQPELIVIEDPEFQMDLESGYLLRQWIQAMCEEGVSIFMTVPSLESALTLTEDVIRWTPSGFKPVLIENENQSSEHIGWRVAVAADPEAVCDIGGSDPDGSAAPLDAPLSPPAASDRIDAEAGSDAEDPLESKEGEEAEASGQRWYPPLSFDKIPARVEDKIMLIDPLEMNFIESQDGTSQLHVHTGVYPCSMTLAELEKKLKPFGFFRCHRSYLVNLQRVREVIIWSRNSYSLVLDDEKKSTVPLSKNKYEEMKTIMGIS
ncbi:LytTR family transcriptional regulator DNA-binding domain-containing protein [Paenibacillus apiarius]|uniref:LytTR family transcriptional regulator DNA-binding domain-containing protein n=1 Tax=Paenibacillus apiarius TaxID=46240 RepID=A0ABT4DND4_9BACL|nr:LytTR family transcriptional regulator DNA-binding domain-containing protein [Paenibacillus apiarius]MBN3524044.1 LytTR family transcriptional regulator DNA-binding domain-containing protein [Paenibacillus apiarius]MCY9515462.1 LytTR family transcriptional regulator DNA-binding domain-containing protein [Paenibacillus apiarius]MCY9518871.1 LytTR family transcriptional regulator DNA-binding domain-containing protein [Paenibacillus apiarius]MCY9552082.1 LytTR family transcriptional regulator D